MSELVNQKCIACQGDEPTLTKDEIQRLKPQVPDWQVKRENGEDQLIRTFKFDNFRQALKFTNQVGEIAEEQDHHPLLQTEWGKVSVAWWTHKIGGLHRNDFIMAAKTDEIYKKDWTA